MPTLPQSPVQLEAATHLLDRAAHQQFSQFMEALRAARDAAMIDVLGAEGADRTLVAKGVAMAYADLVTRMEGAEATLVKAQEAQARNAAKQKERAR